MLNLLPNRVLAFAMPWLLTASVWSATCKAQISNDQKTVLTSAHDFLQATYPELLGKNLQLSLHIMQAMEASWRRVDEMRFEVALYDPRSERMLNPPFDAQSGKQMTPPKNPFLLQGDIRFDSDGRLQQFSVGNSALAHYKENEAIRKLIESHPEWSETQASAELKRSGARYGPEKKRVR